MCVLAMCSFPQGLIVGNVIVGKLLGGNGQVNDDFRCLMSFSCTAGRPNLRKLALDVSREQPPCASP